MCKRPTHNLLYGLNSKRNPVGRALTSLSLHGGSRQMAKGPYELGQDMA